MQEQVPDSGNNPINVSAVPSSPSSSLITKLKSKKIIIPIFLLVIIIAITGIILINRSNQKKLADTPESVVAMVGEDKIYKSDVESEARKQYAEKDITWEVLTATTDKLIEEKILIQEAEKLGIQVSDEEVLESAKAAVKDKQNIPEIFLEKARINIYRWKVKSQVVDSRTAYSIEYWTPDEEYIEQAKFPEGKLEKIRKQQSEGKDALLELEEIVRKGEDEFSAAKDLIIEDDDYSDIKEILAVNGYILKDTQNQSLLKTPRVYTQEDRKSMGDRFFDALWELNEGDITLVFADNYSAGKIFHVVKSTNSNFKTYEEWLDSKKKEIVQLQ